jgi:hypothetical protein
MTHAWTRLLSLPDRENRDSIHHLSQIKAFLEGIHFASTAFILLVTALRRLLYSLVIECLNGCRMLKPFIPAVPLFPTFRALARDLIDRHALQCRGTNYIVRTAGFFFKRKHTSHSPEETELPPVASNTNSNLTNHSQETSETSMTTCDNGTRLTSMSPLHGLNAIVLFLLFVVFGVWIPFFLTGASFGAAIVRTKFTRHCNNIALPCNDPLVDTQLRIAGLADSLFEQCKDQSLALCPDVLSHKFEIEFNHVDCPFHPKVCTNKTGALQLIHYDIRNVHLGINAEDQVRVNHQLTCAPIFLDQFLRTKNGRSSLSVNNFEDKEELGWQRYNCSMTLESHNGPNQFYDEFSGPIAADAVDLTILLYFHGDV